MFEKNLEELGLGDKEAAVYVALLSVDHASVLDVAKKTKIKRPTVYVALDSLEKKGLVSETQIGKKVHYQAEPPERLETYVERQKTALLEQQKRLKDFIPQLKSIQRQSGERPMVKYFEGREGVVSSFEEFLQGKEDQGGTAYIIYPRDLRDEIFSREEISNYQKQRIQKNINTKVLYTFEKGDIPSDEHGNRLKIDGAKYPITCDITIYGDKVRISILGKKLSAIFIRSQDFAQTLKSLVDLVFDSAKK